MLQELERYIGRTEPLLPQGSWSGVQHHYEKEPVYAIMSAVASERPLLVRGEPGVGKSQLARAAAKMLARHFISFVVQPGSEYQDLLWTFDQVARLGKAQLMAAGQGNVKDELDPSKFICPGPLWWAYNWENAEELSNKNGGYCPIQPKCKKDLQSGIVLLVDEIDKADVDLPNGLLETLGNNSFDVPYLKDSIHPIGSKPLVIITSNNQRELPPAFLRRCVVLDLKLPDGDDLESHLVKIGRTHFNNLNIGILKEAARQTRVDRESTGDSTVRVGQAEFLDLLRAINSLAPGNTRKQKRYLKSLSKFILQKHEGTEA